MANKNERWLFTTALQKNVNKYLKEIFFMIGQIESFRGKNTSTVLLNAKLIYVLW